MFNRSRRLVSQGSGVALAAVMAVSFAGHMNNGMASLSGARSSDAVATSGRAGASPARTAHNITNADFSVLCFHDNK